MLPEVIALNSFQLQDADFSHPPFAPAFCPVVPMAASVWVQGCHPRGHQLTSFWGGKWPEEGSRGASLAEK